jgi:hypothetical protein
LQDILSAPGPGVVTSEKDSNYYLKKIRAAIWMRYEALF